MERVIRKIELQSQNDQKASSCKLMTHTAKAILAVSSKNRADTLRKLTIAVSQANHSKVTSVVPLLSKFARETRAQLDNIQDLTKSIKVFARRAILSSTTPDLAREVAQTVKHLESDIPFLFRALMTTTFLLKQEENPSENTDLLDELMDIENQDSDWHKGTAFSSVPADLDPSTLVTPNSIEEAKNTPEWEYWKEAIHAELCSHHKNQTFTEVDIKPGTKTIGSRWVFKIKTENGKVTRFKARLVAQVSARSKASILLIPGHQHFRTPFYASF